MFRSVLAAVLLVLGMMQLEDARRLQGGGMSLFRTDWTKKVRSWRHFQPKARLLFPLRGALLPCACSCVGGVYIDIIGINSSQGFASAGLVYLMIYNLGIALPVLRCSWEESSLLGMSPEQVDHFRNKHRVAIRLTTGITLFGAGTAHVLADD